MKTMASLIVMFAVVLLPFSLFAQQQPASQPEAGKTPLSTEQQLAQPDTSMSEQQAPAETESESPESPMMKRCSAMMAQADEVMQKIDEMEKTLDKQVSAMNAAQGQKKIDDMATVINTLVTQRKEMREMMTKLHHGMMFHIMAHRETCPMQGIGKMSSMGGMGMKSMMRKMKKGMEVEAGNDMVVIIQK